MLHVTGNKPQEGLLSTVNNTLGWFFLGQNSSSSQEVKGLILILREDEPDSMTYDLKSKIELHETVVICLTQPVCAHYDPATLMLSVGYQSGKIDCYVLTPENSYTQFKLFTTIKDHKKSVIGLQTQGLQSNLISVSKEQVLLGFDISQEKNYRIAERILTAPITCLFYDQPTDVLLIGTDKGEFYSYTFKVGKNHFREKSLSARLLSLIASKIRLFRFILSLREDTCLWCLKTEA